MSQLIPITVAIICLVKIALEVFSIIPTKTFVKIFFMNPKMDTTSINIRRFRFLDVLLNATVVITCLLFLVSKAVRVVLVATPVVLIIILLMYNLRKEKNV